MSIEPGTIIAVAAVLLFYLRLIILQRQKVKETAVQAKAEAKKKTKKNQPLPIIPAGGGMAAVPRLDIYRPYMVGAGMVIILAGAVLAAAPWFDDSIRSWWWLPVTAGIVLMSLGIR